MVRARRACGSTAGFVDVSCSLTTVVSVDGTILHELVIEAMPPPRSIRRLRPARFDATAHDHTLGRRAIVRR